MAKYKQSREDRRHESEGMERYERDHGKAKYKHLDQIREDKSAVANLPQKAMMFEVGCGVERKNYGYDDTMTGIDDMGFQNVGKVNRYMDKD